MNVDPQPGGNKPGVLLPAPTAWPFTLAIGTALGFAGLLTSVSVSVLGAIIAALGAVGWFREVLPQEREEVVAVEREAAAPVHPPRLVARVAVAKEIERAWLPLKTYPMSAGIKGGLAGGVAMAALAMLYGLIFFHSVWYPINLIAGSLYTPSAMPSMDALTRFNAGWFLFALAMHVTMCLLVGLLYGAMLPLLPRAPILLGGVIAPLLWTSLLYQIIPYVNPLLEDQINWRWFAASQAAFGLVAGWVVTRYHREWTKENLPLAVRAGIEAPGIIEEREERDEQ
jgi:hypothetical protein